MSETCTQLNQWCHDHPSVHKELEALREAVKEALTEARRSSSFCQKIQHNISEFVRSDKLTRKQGDEALDNVKLLRLTMNSVDERLLSFGNSIIGKVQEEVRDNTHKDLSAKLDVCLVQLEKIEAQQREHEGKLEALVAEAAHRQSSMRKQMKGYAVKVGASLRALEAGLRSQPLAAWRHPDGPGGAAATGIGAGLLDVGREVVNVLSALSGRLEAERRVYEEERQRWLLLMQRVVEKIRDLGDRNEALEVEVRELRRVPVRCPVDCHESIGRVAVELEGKCGIVNSVPALGDVIHYNGSGCGSCISTQTDFHMQSQLDELRNELDRMGLAVRELHAERDQHQYALRENEGRIVALRRSQENLESLLRAMWSWMQRAQNELRNCRNEPQEILGDEKGTRKHPVVSEKNGVQQMYWPKTTSAL
ncbi:hypothetical protein DQ04_03251110 [Trypanosoma grayi]|uniref:hypothetical protein n=1 Tax=Trypanosoma grayi TaxID=71804 RepID=UPI0004F48B34|nr:hypothetical protein DQ04_03251110 [Trypanosoma grayi]KEG10833.1 hypothetical protein DQ04_03251110 [Trypanosoma grayi]